MNYHILYNPLCGKGTAEENAKTLEITLNGRCILYDITKITDYLDLVSTMDTEDCIIICGGDGTLNRFINDTEGINIKSKILYCASGTGNDFLKDLEKDISDNPIEINEYIKDLPYVTVKGKRYHFLNNVGFGIDGYCCEVGDTLKKSSTKAVNYTSIAIKGLLFHFKPRGATVTVDGRDYRYEKVWLAPTMKGRYYGGGMMPTPDQNRADPSRELSLMVMHGSGKLKTLMIFPSISKGTHVKHTKHVSIHKGKEISVKFDTPCAIQIDGETILDVTSYTAYASVNTPSLV